MKKILKILAAFVACLIILIFIAIGTLIYFSFGLPRISTLADYAPPVPSQILAKDGTVLAEIGKERRQLTAFEEIPKRIIDAFIAAEDDAFFQHKGVDYWGVLRAFKANLKAGRVVQGGSTITQQVAKSLLLSSERSYTRKIKDFLLARRIEQKFSKEEILFLYLNQMYFGGGFYGVKTAFRGYFDKELSEVTLAESAMVAGLLVAPGRYSPYINPKEAKKRQKYVLDRLLATGKILSDEYENALKEVIKFRIRKKRYFKAGYFTDWVRQRIIEEVGEDNFLTNGFRVTTTLDYDLQKKAEKIVKDGCKKIDKRQGFRGPIKNLNINELNEYEKKLRKDLYRKKSNYFTISDNFQKKFELEFDEANFNEIVESRREWKDKIGYRNFQAGIFLKDKFIDYLEEEKNYKAFVIGIDDIGKIIYVSIGGIPGIIDYKGYRWAHERIISEKKNFFPYVNRPSEIVKMGDIILINLKKKSTSLWKHLSKTAINRYQKYQNIREVKKQSYLLCELDQEPEVQGAIISISPDNEEVVAFVGGTDFQKSQFNRVIQSKRQPGSSFKPILYAVGLENGFTPASVIIDSPEALGGVDKSLNWKPRNYDGKFLGPITFRNALEQSRNVPSIKVAEKVGMSKILEFVNRIRFNAKLEYDLTQALGSFGVSLFDIVSTYAIFPNKGKKLKIKSIISIVDRNGRNYKIDEHEDRRSKTKKEDVQEDTTLEMRPLQEGDKNYVAINGTNKSGRVGEKLHFDIRPEKMNPYHINLNEEQVYDPRLAYIMTNLLRGVVLHGTGRSAKNVSQFLGGKTGTTNSYVDAWFIGFSANLVTGVWTGFDDNKTLGWGETGHKAALPIWKDFMRQGIKKFGEYDFQMPGGIINVLINKKNGKPAKEGEENAFMEAFVEGTEPGREIVYDEKISLEDNIFEEDDYYNNQ